MNVFGWYDQEITELLPNFLGVTIGIEGFFSLSLCRDIWVPGAAVAVPSSDGGYFSQNKQNISFRVQSVLFIFQKQWVSKWSLVTVEARPG